MKTYYRGKYTIYGIQSAIQQLPAAGSALPTTQRLLSGQAQVALRNQLPVPPRTPRHASKCNLRASYWTMKMSWQNSNTCTA